MLEFICALQSEHLTPEKLFHELEHNHLLLIGSDFSNWLARLFLRMAKRKRLSDPRDVTEVFADDHTMQDSRLVAFLQQVSVRTRVYGGAEAFVAELHARWTRRQRPPMGSSGSAGAPQRFLPPAREMPENAVFDLGPNMWFVWNQLGQMQAQMGDFGASTQSVKGFVHDTSVLIAPLPANDPRRQLLANPAQQMNARLELVAGQNQAAFNDAMAIVARLDMVKTIQGSSAELMKRNFLSGVLFTATHAAIRLGSYPQAEALARRWLALPPNQKSEDDPRIQSSQAATALGHALAMQGRNDEAQAILQPALAFYRGEQHVGAAGTSFRQDFAYALFVSALSRANDAGGRAKRSGDLADSVQLLDGMSVLARQLASVRELSGLITGSRVK